MEASLQEGMHDYTLKTDEEIIKILCEFGSGETDFHTADVERLLKQKQWQEKRIKELESESANLEAELDAAAEWANDRGYYISKESFRENMKLKAAGGSS